MSRRYPDFLNKLSWRIIIPVYGETELLVMVRTPAPPKPRTRPRSSNCMSKSNTRAPPWPLWQKKINNIFFRMMKANQSTLSMHTSIRQRRNAQGIVPLMHTIQKSIRPMEEPPRTKCLEKKHDKKFSNGHTENKKSFLCKKVWVT